MSLQSLPACILNHIEDNLQSREGEGMAIRINTTGEWKGKIVTEEKSAVSEFNLNATWSIDTKAKDLKKKNPPDIVIEVQQVKDGKPFRVEITQGEF